MAAVAVITIKIADLDRTRLFLWELMQLRDAMRVMASPHAEQLDRLIERYAAGFADEHDADLDG
jgi:hypothetical protein